MATKDEKTIIAGVDVSGLPLDVQKAIREAAQKAASRVVEREKAKETAKLDELKKWEGLASAIAGAMTKDQLDAIGDGSFRIWFENGKPKSWRVFASRNGNKAGGSNAVYYHDVDNKRHIEFASGEALCQYLGLDTNGNSSTRVLEANKIPFVRTKPAGAIVKAK